MAFHAGDTPADHPGASRVPSAAPTAFHAGDTPANNPGARRPAVAERHGWRNVAGRA
jgi:hypothetical protein